MFNRERGEAQFVFTIRRLSSLRGNRLARRARVVSHGPCTADGGGIRKEMLGNLGASGSPVGEPHILSLHLHRVSSAGVEGLKGGEQLT